jgi:hypothetical protein
LIVGFAAPTTASGDTVTCADGTTSEAGRGACSHHGGVEKTRTRAESKAKPTRVARIRCNDGTLSQSTGRGVCSRHGGVADDGPINPDRLEPKPRTSEPRERAPMKREARRAEPQGRVRLPAPGLVVRCADGTISLKAGRGACSRHGGVVDEPDTLGHQLPPKEKETRDRSWWGSDAPKAGEPLARCVDGTLSYSKQHSGTCSSHGGVRDWLDD